MPIYEYVCRGCSNLFEELGSDADSPACPHCGSLNVRRLLSAPAELTGRERNATPDAQGHGCCGSRPGDKGCVPGSCCGKA